MAGSAQAAIPLEDWNREAGRVRLLAENDAPRAYEAAQQLQTKLPSDATPADQARLLNLLARIENYLALTSLASEHAGLALELATRHADRVGQAEAQLNYSLSYVNEAKIDRLYAAATQGLEALDGIDRPDLLGEALLRTMLMYRRTGQIDDAVVMSMHAMEVARRTGDPFALTYAHQGMGLSFAQSDRPTEARGSFQEMRTHARVADSKLLEADALLGMATAAGSLGNAKDAETYVREAIALYRAVGAPFSLNTGLFGLSFQYRLQGRYTEALPLLNEVIAVFEHYPNKIGQWYALTARSATLLALGNRAAADDDSQNAYNLAREIGLPLYLGQSEQLMGKIAAAGGDYRRAYELSVASTETAERAAREGISTRMLELAKRYESESRQREINELVDRNEKQSDELHNQALHQRWLWTVLGGSFAVLAVTVFFLLRLHRSHGLLETTHTQLQKSQNELQQQSEEVRRLNASLEQRVQERTAQLKTANKELEAFSYSVSHDLRTPLRTIDGFSAILAEDYAGRLDEKGAKSLGCIRDATRRMGQIVDDLLMLSRASRGEISRSTVDLSELVRAVAQDLRESAPERQVEFIIAQNLTATADVRLMRIVFENLLGNAWKFTGRQAHARIEFGQKTNGAVRTYFVRDNGVGFDAQHADRIFDPFERLHSAAEFPGTGIGLATVHRIIERHGSRVWAESEPGQGATFCFTLGA